VAWCSWLSVKVVMLSGYLRDGQMMHFSAVHIIWCGRKLDCNALIHFCAFSLRACAGGLEEPDKDWTTPTTLRPYEGSIHLMGTLSWGELLTVIWPGREHIVCGFHLPCCLRIARIDQEHFLRERFPPVACRLPCQRSTFFWRWLITGPLGCRGE